MDKVFCANAGLLVNDKFIVSNFSAKPRKRETYHYSDYFNKNQYKLYFTDNNFEGAGDALFSHHNENLWLGYGFRSNENIQSEVKDILEFDNVFKLKLINPKWYHLDTCFFPFGNKLLYYPDAFDKESNNQICEHFNKNDRYAISQEDAENFACNAIAIDNNLFFYKISDELKRLLETMGFNCWLDL